MPIELRVLTGERAGQSDWFEQSVISIGRHPSSDFQLDIKKDLDVSRRHGEIRFDGTGYKLYDRDSTNGTYLNDQQLPPGGSRDLNNGDTIKFGAQGPTVAVLITSAPPAPVARGGLGSSIRRAMVDRSNVEPANVERANVDQ